MNKKRLSVVMAGAMLATSVAPVLAAEVQKSEHSANELGLLQKEMRDLVHSKTFSKDSKNAPASLPNLKGKSVYAIYVNGRDTGLDVHSTQEQWQNVFNDLKNGDKVEVFNKGYKEVDGKVLGYEYKEASVKKYTTTRLEELEAQINGETKYISGGSARWGIYSSLIKEDGAKYDKSTGRLTIEFKGDVTINGENFNTIVFDTNTTEKDLYNYFINEDGDKDRIDEYTTPGDFYGFPESTTAIDPEGYKDIASSLEREITITPGGMDLTVDELYDGLVLTEKGHEFFEMLKEARKDGRHVTIEGNYNKMLIGYDGRDYRQVAQAIKLYDKKCKFTVTLSANKGRAEEVYTITGTNEANAERLADWMIAPKARVDIFDGANRFETAVKIAKEYANLTSNTVAPYGSDANIVLVNSEALVDGLAAAPLASTLSSNHYKTPVLLTNADSIPKETEGYLKEVLAEVRIGHLDEVTVHLVGGESVLNKSLERKLKSLGFNVERYGGENREETSLKVAEAMEDMYGAKDDRAFLVGANGAADAMSISAVAAKSKTPIVVSKAGGVSEDALYELRNKAVTVIGGNKAVSEADYNAVKAEAKSISRVHGENRKATNAEIISKYYKRNFIEAKSVIVAKDGTKRELDLVDALAAANMASVKNAPIVLATDSLSKAQENALELNAKTAKELYQVGLGVDKENVLRVIAKNLGLTNLYN